MHNVSLLRILNKIKAVNFNQQINLLGCMCKSFVIALAQYCSSFQSIFFSKKILRVGIEVFRPINQRDQQVKRSSGSSTKRQGLLGPRPKDRVFWPICQSFRIGRGGIIAPKRLLWISSLVGWPCVRLKDLRAIYANQLAVTQPFKTILSLLARSICNCLSNRFYHPLLIQGDQRIGQKTFSLLIQRDQHIGQKTFKKVFWPRKGLLAETYASILC